MLLRPSRRSKKSATSYVYLKVRHMKQINILFLVFFFFLALACEKEDPKPTNQGTGDNDTTDNGMTDSDSTDEDTNKTDPEKVISYLALGDSYTIGESVSAAERYPVLLAEELKEKGIEVVGPKIIATTGWTTADLMRGIENADIEDKKYDLVSLLIGVNNQYRGRSLEEYKKEFRELLLQSIAFANGDKDKVFVISIPDYGYTPFGESRKEAISAEIDAFNAANREITESMGVKYFDITPISRNGLTDPELVAGDGLHPSGKMYRQWVDLMKEEVLEMVK